MDFHRSADYLLNKCVLLLGLHTYRILEVEFYVHCREQQQELWTLYFHSGRSPHSYRGGTYKGLDITCGCPGNYCGILIRSIYCLETKQIIEGPCLVVNKILEEFKVSSIYDLVSMWNFDISANKILFELHHQHNDDIFCGPRVGIKGDSPWRYLPYRFLIFKDLIKKQKSSLVSAIIEPNIIIVD